MSHFPVTRALALLLTRTRASGVAFEDVLTGLFPAAVATRGVAVDTLTIRFGFWCVGMAVILALAAVGFCLNCFCEGVAAYLAVGVFVFWLG